MLVDTMMNIQRHAKHSGPRTALIALAVAALLFGVIGMHVVMSSSPMAAQPAAATAPAGHAAPGSGQTGSNGANVETMPGMSCCGEPSESGSSMSSPCPPLQPSPFNLSTQAQLQPLLPAVPPLQSQHTPIDADPDPPSLQHLSIDRR